MTFVFNEITQFAWLFHEFYQIDHEFIFLLNSENQRAIQILIVKSFRFFKIRISDSFYSSQWINDIVSLQNAINQFRVDIQQFKQSKIFRNFLSRSEIANSTFNNSISSSMSRVIRLETLVQFIVSDQFDVFVSSKFRRNSVSEIRSFNFSSRAFSYFFIINSDSESNIFRQFIIESKTIDSEHSVENTQFDSNQTNNNQTFFFIQIENIRRIMFSIISSSTEVNSTLWNDIMIVIIAFVSVFRFVVETFFFVNNNNDLQSIIKFAENVDYFDSNYEDSIDSDQSIVSFDKHNFYRDVYIFIDHFKNLNKITSDFRIKKFVIICFKKEVLRWYNSKFTEIEKNFFKKTTIERWCTHLIKRFKKKNFVALKKLQIEFYIYVDVRRERKSRVYMQNILRYFRTSRLESFFKKNFVENS